MLAGARIPTWALKRAALRALILQIRYLMFPTYVKSTLFNST